MLTSVLSQQRFLSNFGAEIRTQLRDNVPLFCANDVCAALGIQNARRKVRKLDEDEKVHAHSQSRQLYYVTEPGLYTLILTCSDALKVGTPCYRFRRWVTHEVLPKIRQNALLLAQKQAAKTLLAEVREEKTRRLWTVFSDMNIYTYNVRRKYFGNVCRATKDLCYICEADRAPYVCSQHIDECMSRIQRLVSNWISEDIPHNQPKITEFMCENECKRKGPQTSTFPNSTKCT